MNTNSNLYTIVYSAIIVILVAAILAFVATSLKPLQLANQKAETISQMLTAAQYGSKEELSGSGNEQILEMYKEYIKDAFLIDINGKRVSDLNTGKTKASDIEIFDALKLENSKFKSNELKKVRIPVYIFKKDAQEITVLPIYGGGLWGPVWGYLAINTHNCSIIGAYFDHESETPGLGAKIKDESWFRDSFIGKKINLDGENSFEISKKGKVTLPDSHVDAISGATLTSMGLNGAINTWLSGYRNYLKKVTADNDYCCESCKADAEAFKKQQESTKSEEK